MPVPRDVFMDKPKHVAQALDNERYRLKLDFCLTVRHQLSKVIQMNQLDATMIY